jgi:flagellum-specific peptidoglycan hydrolase FlgJ
MIFAISSPLLKQYQHFLSDIDVIAAKAKYANRINGILPSQIIADCILETPTIPFYI